MRCLRATAFAFCLFAQAGLAMAQNASPGTDPQATPNLQLSEAQKQTIYTSVTNLNMKNEAPPAFHPIVGASAPPELDLQPMPKTIVELIPRTADFRVVLVAGQVAIVEPETRKVVEVIAGEKK